MTKINTQWWASAGADKSTRVKRSECIDQESREMYEYTAGGRLSFKEKFDWSCWQITSGAKVLETFESEEAGVDRYHELLLNKIAVGIILGHAYMRENIGGFSGAAAYSGWVRT